MGASGGIIIGSVENLKFKINSKEKLGEGAFGTVYTAECTSKILPVKIVCKVVDIKGNV